VTASAARRPAATFVAAAAPPLSVSFSLSFTHAADDAAFPTYVVRFESTIVDRRTAGNRVLSRHRGDGGDDGDGDDDGERATTMTPRRRPRGPRLPSLPVSLSRPGGASLTPGCLPLSPLLLLPVLLRTPPATAPAPLLSPPAAATATATTVTSTAAATTTMTVVFHSLATTHHHHHCHHHHHHHHYWHFHRHDGHHDDGDDGDGDGSEYDDDGGTSPAAHPCFPLNDGGVYAAPLLLAGLDDASDASTRVYAHAHEPSRRLCRPPTTLLLRAVARSPLRPLLSLLPPFLLPSTSFSVFLSAVTPSYRPVLLALTRTHVSPRMRIRRGALCESCRVCARVYTRIYISLCIVYSSLSLSITHART